MKGFVAAVIAAIFSLFGIHQAPAQTASTPPRAQVASAVNAVEDPFHHVSNATRTTTPHSATTGSTPSPQATVTKQPARLNDVSRSGGYITQPVIEKIVQSAPFATGRVLGASTDETTAKLADLQNQINALSHLPTSVFVPSFSGPAATTPVSTETFASSQKIDKLTNVTLTNATVNGISGITAADIPAGITASNYLPLSGGTVTGTLNISTLNASSSDNVRYANQFPGSNAGAKIQAAINDLPSTGGIVDARGLTGTQTISSSVTVGGLTKPVHLILGRATITTSQTITIDKNSSIIGVPDPMGIGGTNGGTIIKESAGSNLSSVITLVDGFNVLQDVTVDGNTSNNPSAGVGVLVNLSNRPSLFRVTVQNSTSHGIQVTSNSGIGNESCCGKFLNVMSIDNGGNGLYILNTNDTFINQSEFENNTLAGIELDNSAATRITNSDFGGNQGDGLYAHGTSLPASNTSGYEVITGNQFGGNHNHDITPVRQLTEEIQLVGIDGI